MDERSKAKDFALSTQYSLFKGHNSGFTPNKTLVLSQSRPKLEFTPKKQSLDLSNDQIDSFPNTTKFRSKDGRKLRTTNSRISIKEAVRSANKSFTEEQKEKQLKQKALNQNLEEQVDEVAKILEFGFQKKQADILFDKIYGRMVNWEIFDEKQVTNAVAALEKMHKSNQLSFTERNMPAKLAKVLKSSKYPENIRLSIAALFNNVVKNKTLKKYFLTKTVVEACAAFLLDYKQVVSNLSPEQKA